MIAEKFSMNQQGLSQQLECRIIGMHFEMDLDSGQHIHRLRLEHMSGMINAYIKAGDKVAPLKKIKRKQWASVVLRKQPAPIGNVDYRIVQLQLTHVRTNNTTPSLHTSCVAKAGAITALTTGSAENKQAKIKRRKLAPPPSINGNTSKCSVCGSPDVWPKKHGMCPKHYRRWYNKNHRDANKRREQVRECYRRNPANALLSLYKSKAKRENREFDLDRDWIQSRLDKGRCEVTGLPFAKGRFGEKPGKYRQDPWAISIDRIDNRKGYTKDNCRMVVWSLNRAKGNYPDEVLLKLAAALVNPPLL